MRKSNIFFHGDFVPMKKIKLNFKRLLEIHFNNVKDPLMAIYEAIVNSIQSIEELGKKNDGFIDVFIQRVDDYLKFNELEKNKNIENIIITDNGIGFTEANFLSFSTYASELKINKGCKGIGRLTWLKFFDFVKIQSQYKENEKFYKRSFLFTENEIEDDELNELNYSENNTVVELKHFKNTFSLDLDNIANKILNHLFIYFLNDNIPIIILRDNEKQVNLNDLFAKQKQENMIQEEIQIGGENFSILHFKNYSLLSDTHCLFYCANNRTVQKNNINNDIKVHTKLIDDKGNFVYNGYIISTFLDDNVNQDRTDFYIENDSKELLLPNFLTKENIKINIIPNVLHFLKDNIETYRDFKQKKVENYIYKKNPKYRYLLKFYPKFIDEINIKEKFKEEDLEFEIFKQEQKYSLKLKEKGFELKNKFQQNQYNQDISQKIIEYAKEISEVGKKDLVDYILKRKIVLDILEKNMEYINSDNDKPTYALEKAIHELIFPMHNTSDDIEYESHNLWIIDERLAYHYYLASDKSLKTLPEISCENKSEPDIIIFNNAFAISNEKGKFNDIIIIEFKRPNRDNYTYEDNPIEQIINYVKAIKNGEIKQKNGSPINGCKNVRFFCYIIADITPTFDKILEREDFIALLDNGDNGYYKYHQKYQSYIEVIPYYKLLQNAEQRNKILFDKLKLD